MTTTIQKWGNSQGIRIPKTILDTVKWTENEKIILVVENEKIIMEKAKKKRKNIKELFADYEGEYEPIEIEWGEAKGEEIW
ncbi:MAG: AbrB/MazE/SpoVT family DNA-binding domain-containing protein [Clostridia bacterium]|nr:AbrB/MazE/SpoVT family DNA-binding domain-containing protein [Clostridium sp.]